jgi:membrane associated rhomboid family serine protease
MNFKNVFRKLQPEYNAPVTLTLTFVSIAMCLIIMAFGESIQHFFATKPSIDPLSPMFYVRLVNHIFIHADWSHLLNNFALILILGPNLEEKLGSFKLALLILATAIVAALTNALLSSNGLIGASCIAYMFIFLSAFGKRATAKIPLTIMLVAILYVSQEIVGMFKDDNISHTSHLVSGACGALFGFLLNDKK